MKKNGNVSINGNYIVVDNLNTKQQALNKIRKKDWDIIITATAIYHEIIKDFEKIKRTKNTNN